MSGFARTEALSDDSNGSSRAWRKSSFTYGGGNCVEVAALYGARIDVRDSKNPAGSVLRFTATEWNAFLAGLRSSKRRL